MRGMKLQQFGKFEVKKQQKQLRSAKETNMYLVTN